jgi:hypothetical protein
VVARLDHDAADLPRRRRHAALLVLRPAATSDESCGGSGGFGGAFVLLIFVGAVVKFWLWVLAAIAAVALIALVFVLVNRSDKRRAAQLNQVAAIARRADQQHAWTLAGDNRGIYGEYRPEVYPTG